MVTVKVTRFKGGFFIDHIDCGRIVKPTFELFEDLYRLKLYVDCWLADKSFLQNNYELLITHHE